MAVKPNVVKILGLGIAQTVGWDFVITGGGTDKNKEISGNTSTTTQGTHSPTPPTQRRLAKSFSVTPSSVTKGLHIFLLYITFSLLHVRYKNKRTSFFFFFFCTLLYIFRR